MVSTMITNMIMNRIQGYESAGYEFSWTRWVRSVIAGRYALMVLIIILGGIYSGLFTPTEAAAVAVVSTLTIGFMQKKTSHS